tara:strand:- start:48 stop:155 length:108 start_codon:yes stop_codon:yes gene_type:complete
MNGELGIGELEIMNIQYRIIKFYRGIRNKEYENYE